jgi:hypothetical protein
MGDFHAEYRGDTEMDTPTCDNRRVLKRQSLYRVICGRAGCVVGRQRTGNSRAAGFDVCAISVET